MSYVVIPVPPQPNPNFSCVLDGRLAQFQFHTTDFGLFADIVYNGSSVETGRLCLDRTDINPNRYRGLPQGLFFVDTIGVTDPVYTGFGTRYLLIYGDPSSNGGSVVG